MTIARLLVANRGEIAIRVMRAAADLGIETVAVYSEDDASSLHVRRAGAARQLSGRGAAAYLDLEQILSLAREAGCDAIHPGYGFLSEQPALARRCAELGITFVGPPPEAVALMGDKARARGAAREAGVPVLDGPAGAVTLEEAAAFFAGLPSGFAMAIKAIAGGGGRGIRSVFAASELPEAYARCESEARQAFGDGSLYVERWLPHARHVEVQVAGDHTGAVSHFWERECSVQRRHQKIVEIAPAPALHSDLRARILEAAVCLAKAARYENLGTFEFLVATPEDGAEPGPDAFFAFIEANARLQVEHTVTEQVTGVDLVQLQLRLATGETLAGLGLSQAQIPPPRGFAIQARVNMETIEADGSTRPAGGVLTAYEPPSGPGVRVDGYGYAGYRTNPNFDSLLAKVIGHAPTGGFAEAARRTARALGEFTVEGVATNAPFLRALLGDPDFVAGRLSTRFLDDHAAELVAASAAFRPQPATVVEPAAGRGLAGAGLRATDPLAVLAYGKQSDAPGSRTAATAQPQLEEGVATLAAPIQGTIVSIVVEPGALVRRGELVLVMSAMKMEHEVQAPVGGIIRTITVGIGDTVYEGHALAYIEEQQAAGEALQEAAEVALDHIRPDLAEVLDRQAATLDAARPQAVERRRKTRQRTARENVGDLCDAGTFTEYGGLGLTPGTGLSLEEVVKKFPADGMVTGIGSINGTLFDESAARCVVMAYDYTVLAGTQGALNHPKTDRMLELAEKWRRPVVLFAEGGGGRAGTGGKREGGRSTEGPPDVFGGRPLDTPTFASMARLSGLVPLVGITSGFCFAGNAVLLGCCDVIIATANSNIGMGGPAMVEGGNLGVFLPTEIGGMDVQVPNGVVDIAVEDEAEAVQAAKRYLSYFQGAVSDWECADQRRMRSLVPENRLRIYDVRKVVETLADTGSVLELRRHFGLGMVTSFIRIEGRPMGVIANNAAHLAGAIDSDGADKAARFMQLCDAFDIPILILCDTPGIMVGPEIERTALVRHSSRLFVTGANLTVPHFTVVLRKAYGLGAQAMAAGNFKEPMFAVAWPTGEFGGMGLEGQVKLGFRNELAAIEDADDRVRRYEELVERAYQRGKALSQGVSFGVDNVIDPADTRSWLSSGLRSLPHRNVREEKKRRNVDTW